VPFVPAEALAEWCVSLCRLTDVTTKSSSAYSSVRRSLKRLLVMANDRQREEEESKRTGIEREARRIEDAEVRARKLVEARKRQRRQRKIERLAAAREREVRLDAIHQSELVKARIASEADAALERMAFDQRWERELIGMRNDKSATRMRGFTALMVCAVLLLGASAAYAQHNTEQRHRQALMSERAHAARLQVQRVELRETVVDGELRLSKLRLEMKEHAAADLVLAKSKSVTPTPATRKPRRASRTAPPRTAPPPPAAPECDDSNGDPCCAFGQMLC